jgi:hypothetical protein
MSAPVAEGMSHGGDDDVALVMPLKAPGFRRSGPND